MMGRALLGSTLAMIAVLGSVATPRPSSLGEARARIESGYGKLPLRFERNEGQVDPRVRYLARGPGYTMFVTPTRMVLSLRKGAQERRPARLLPGEIAWKEPAGSVLRVELLDARSDAELQALEELPGKTHYFIGNDPKKWRANIASYSKVRCRGVYPGVDLVYHGSQGQLEYDFVVAPGADPRRIRLGFPGAQSLRLDGEGNLVIALGGGELLQRAPQVYQEVDSMRRAVSGRWVLRGKDEAGFELAAYDTTQALVIDPVLSYSTYLGGSNYDGGYGIAVDGSGSAYITGWTYSTGFPTQNPYQTDQASYDVFVTKLSPSGNSLVYSTYLGGNDADVGTGIAVDGSGSAYITGRTSSTDFPTQNPYQTDQASYDVFVTKLSPSGNSLVYSTYLGGSIDDDSAGIAVDGSGSAYVTGLTRSTDFPTQNPYQTYQGFFDVFVTKLSPSGNSLVYSTYLGGNDDDVGHSIAVDGSGGAHVTGYTYSTDFPTQNPYQTDQVYIDVFVTKLSPSGNSLVYSTYLGGSSEDYGNGIAVDGSGSAYVTGYTYSGFPTQNPYQTDQASYDVFVTKLSPSGSSLVYSTYLGGNGVDVGNGIAVDGSGSAYVTGVTSSTDFPTQDPYQMDQASIDAFVTKLSPSGNSLVYSTYLGGNDYEDGHSIAVDGSGGAYVTGLTDSTDFPTQNPYQMYQSLDDVFVVKLTPAMNFFTLSPCRLVDTRNAELGGPALAAGADRPFTLVGRCGLPPTARALSVNLAVTAASVAGNLRLYPTGATLPTVSSINYAAGQTRANNAIVSLNTSGSLTVRCTQASGTAHFILDVNGYFE